LHQLKGAPHVIDLRNLGLIGAVELESRPGEPGARAYEVFRRCYDRGVLVRVTGDIVALSPPFIITLGEIDQLFDVLGSVLKEVA
jgi:beta-alanine--pyruvate transaminase